MRQVEVWSNLNKWRVITVYMGHSYGISYSWGKYDYPFEHYVKMLGSVRAATEGSYGGGTEKWYHDLSTDEAKDRLTLLRDSCRKAGFKLEDRWRVNE